MTEKEEKFKEANQAYEILSDESKRQDYDFRLNHQSTTKENTSRTKSSSKSTTHKWTYWNPNAAWGWGQEDNLNEKINELIETINEKDDILECQEDLLVKENKKIVKLKDAYALEVEKCQNLTKS